jgi:hypothetical protein
MSDAVIISLISGTSSVCIAIITVVIKTWLDARSAAKKAAEDEGIHAEDLGEMIYIQEFVENVREEFQLDRVSICQFHNGGKFLNGRSMKKFSMTYEATALGIEKIKRKYQNVLVSEFPKMVAAMLDKDFFIIDESNSAEFPQAWREMMSNGIIQAVIVPIRGLRGDIMGFISCHSIGERNDLLGYHLRHDFSDRANQISGYLLK